MYDARWNGEMKSFEIENLRAVENNLVALAEKEVVNMEKVNEMLEQLYIPPYKYDLLPEHLKHSNSAKKEKVGRPSLGVTKKISVTLPNDIWEKIGKDISDLDLKSMSAFFRELALDCYMEEDIS